MAAHGSGYARRSRPISPCPRLCGCCGLRCRHPCPLKARRVGQVSAGYQTPPGSGPCRLVRVPKPTKDRTGAGGRPPQCPRVRRPSTARWLPSSAVQTPSTPSSRTPLRSSGVSSCRPRYAAPAGAAARAALARPSHTVQPDRRGPGRLEGARQADRGTGTGSRRQVHRRRPWARRKPSAPCHPTAWKPPPCLHVLLVCHPAHSRSLNRPPAHTALHRPSRPPLLGSGTAGGMESGTQPGSREVPTLPVCQICGLDLSNARTFFRVSWPLCTQSRSCRWHLVPLRWHHHFLQLAAAAWALPCLTGAIQPLPHSLLLGKAEIPAHAGPPAAAIPHLRGARRGEGASGRRRAAALLPAGGTC